MNRLQTAFLALRDYCSRADINGDPIVTITFPDRKSKSKFEVLIHHDGLGYSSDHTVTAPRHSLPPGVDLQIAGIDIVFAVRGPQPSYNSPRGDRY